MFLTVQAIYDLAADGTIVLGSQVTEAYGVPSVPVFFDGQVIQDAMTQAARNRPPMPEHMSRMHHPAMNTFDNSLLRRITDTSDIAVVTHSDGFTLGTRESAVVGASLRIIGDTRGTQMSFRPNVLALVNHAQITGPYVGLGEFCACTPSVFFSIDNLSQFSSIRLKVGDLLGYVSFYN